jgi:hypothetical protein
MAMYISLYIFKHEYKMYSRLACPIFDYSIL